MVVGPSGSASVNVLGIENEKQARPEVKRNRFAHTADGTVIVMLERKHGTALACFVDAADWPKVCVHRWFAQASLQTSYARTHIPNVGGNPRQIKFADA